MPVIPTNAERVAGTFVDELGGHFDGQSLAAHHLHLPDDADVVVWPEANGQREGEADRVSCADNEVRSGLTCMEDADEVDEV